MKRDIENRADIKKLVQSFYERLLKEESFNHIFFEVAEIDILQHLDVLVDFWESVLFQTGKYKGNTLQVHVDLHFKHRLLDVHFQEWLYHFNTTVDDLFEGSKATLAKERALSVAGVIKMKINHLENWRKEINN